MKLRHVLRPVPGGKGAVVVAISAQAAVQTHTPPLPLQLALNLQNYINKYTTGNQTSAYEETNRPQNVLIHSRLAVIRPHDETVQI